MKSFRELLFEPLENRELLASDLSHLANSRGHHDIDVSYFGDFRRGHDLQSQSRFETADGWRSHLTSVQERSNKYSRQSTIELTFARSSITFAVTTAHSPVSPAEGEGSPNYQPILLRAPQSLERTLSIIVLSDRLISIPAVNAPPRSVEGEIYRPTSLRIPNATSDALSAQNSPQTIALLAPSVELPSKLAGSMAESLKNHRAADIRSADLAFVELTFDEDSMVQMIENDQRSKSEIVLDLPVPSGMISLALDSEFQTNDRNTKDAKSLRKHTVGSIENSSLRGVAPNRVQSFGSIAKLDGRLPIPAGMIYLDFATSVLSNCDSATSSSHATLQAGINPLALFQAFVNSQPIVNCVQPLQGEVNDPSREPTSDAKTISWTSIGLVAVLSGFFFAISPVGNNVRKRIRCQPGVRVME